MHNQKKLRNWMLGELELLTDDEMLIQSKAVCSELLKFIDENQFTHIACFIPLKTSSVNEINITSCINTLIMNGKQCYKPCIDKQTDEMYFIPIRKSLTDITPIDFLCADRTLIICPGIVFNNKGHRIGRGKGYYDKYLAWYKTVNKNCVTIGVGFNIQMYDGEWDLNSTDITMDYILTTDYILFPQIIGGKDTIH